MVRARRAARAPDALPGRVERHLQPALDDRPHLREEFAHDVEQLVALRLLDDGQPVDDDGVLHAGVELRLLLIESSILLLPVVLLLVVVRDAHHRRGGSARRLVCRRRADESLVCEAELEARNGRGERASAPERKRRNASLSARASTLNRNSRRGR